MTHRRRRVGMVVLCAAVVATGCTATPTPPSDGASRTPRSPSPSQTPSGPTAGDVLADPDLAADLAPEALREAALTELTLTDGWDDRARSDVETWPVYVGTADIGLDGDVELDVVISAPAEPDGELVLRWLAAAPALGDAVEELTVSVDGRQTDVVVDRPGARVLVAVPDGRAATVRVRASYTVPDRQDIEDDGSPAGYGLLGATDEGVALGHWLPLVTLSTDDGPMVARGDVGGFPAGAFSVRVRHEGTLVSGGDEVACPEGGARCTWLRGLGLRDLSAVLLEDAVTATADGGSTDPAVHADRDASHADGLDEDAQEAAAGLRALTSHLGPLAWDTVDVVAVPLDPGALGMEFPGMVWIDPGAWPDAGGLGSYVLAHELGHQWFHALVGNGSLSAPVVDESLAQYLSVVLFDDVFGQGAGKELAASSLGGRHEQAVAQDVPDDAPAQPLADFSTDRAYGAAVYGRAGQAWVDAEEAAGRDAVLGALRELVEDHGLREVDEGQVLEVLEHHSPPAATIVREGWGLADAG